MITNKQERALKRFAAKVREEQRVRQIFKIKPTVPAVRQALRQLGRS